MSQRDAAGLNVGGRGVFVAMTADRVHSPPMSIAGAIAELRRGSLCCPQCPRLSGAGARLTNTLGRERTQRRVSGANHLTRETPLSDDRAAQQNDEENVLVAISREMVTLFKELFGRGPTRARTYWAGPDMVICLLEETLTPAERNLAAMGEHQRLRDTRMYFQYAAVADFCAPIERHTGRKVRAFFSATDTVADGASVEVFLLHPPGSDEPSRAEAVFSR